MVGASSIGIYAEPANPKRVNELKTENRGAPAAAVTDMLKVAAGEDDVQLSASARLLAKADEQDNELQAERLAEIRKSLEQGTYRVQEVLLQVAARVAKYVE